jgi:hypothetical protein
LVSIAVSGYLPARTPFETDKLLVERKHVLDLVAWVAKGNPNA